MRRTAAAVLAAALLAGCGGGGDDAAAPRSTTTTAAPSSTTTTTTAPPTTTTTIDLVSRPVPPASAAAVAQQLIATDAVIHDTALADDDPRVARAGHEQQVALRALADHPEWDAEVAAALPPALRPVAAENAAANRSLRSLVRSPKPTLPAWTIVEAAPPDELRRYYEEGEATHGVPWEYLAAVHLTETRMGRLRGTSTAGARGPMQFIPSTWAAYGEGDIESNHDSILAAAKYLAANGGARGDLDNALYRYNPTDKYVQAVKRYAERMVADPMAYRGYWGWQVYYWSTLGDVWLRPGWTNAASRPVTPEDLR